MKTLQNNFDIRLENVQAQHKAEMHAKSNQVKQAEEKLEQLRSKDKSEFVQSQ